MAHSYSLQVTENDLTTSINVNVGRSTTQVTTAQKDDHAMVYVWEHIDTIQSSHRCNTHDEARAKAWELAREIGERIGQYTPSTKPSPFS